MSPEKKAKWEMRKARLTSWAKETLPWLFAGATVGAAWGGYLMGISACNRTADHSEAIGELARNQIEDRERMLELERQQNLLFERALKETEGKT